MAILITCDMCGKDVDKTEETNGFGAMTLITKQYTFSKGGKINEQKLTPRDFDICAQCCDKMLEFIEKSKQQTSKKEISKKLEKVEPK